MKLSIYDRFKPYGVAAITVAIAVVATLWLKPLLVPILGSFFFLAVVVSTWYGGIKPGLLTTVSSALAINYFFVPQYAQFTPASFSDIVRLGAFIAVAFVIDLLNSDLQKSQQISTALDVRDACLTEDALRQAKEELESRVIERTDELLQTNARLQQELIERQRVEAALRQSEEKFRQLAENIQDVFWITDPRRQDMIYVSPAYEAVWGRRCEALYGDFTDWLDAIHPEDRQRVETAFFEQVYQGLYDEEYRIIRPDSSIRWIRNRAFLVKDESGEVIRATGIAEDKYLHRIIYNQVLCPIRVSGQFICN